MNLPMLTPLVADGLQAHRDGNKALAHRLYSSALQQNVDDVHANHLLGVLMFQNGRLQQAEKWVTKAVQLAPGFVDPWVNLGVILLAGHQVAKAEDAYRKAIAIDPENDAAWRGLGNTLLEAHDMEASVAAYLKALAIAPDHPETLFNLATLHMQNGNVRQARAYCQKCLDADPTMVPAIGLTADCLIQEGRAKDALTWLDKAIGLAPDHPELHYSRGFTQSDLGNLEEALRSYQESLNLDPIHSGALSAALFTKRQLCDWQDIERLQSRVFDAVKSDAPNMTPFSLLAENDDRGFNLKAAQLWSRQWESIERQYPLLPLDDSHHDKIVTTVSSSFGGNDRITLGYLSADFYQHPTAYLAAGLFEHHNRERFKVIAYSNSRPDNSSIRQRLEAGFDEFRDIRHLSESQAAHQIVQDKVDILVDLKGYTLEAVTGIMARRPAPVQVQYLGFPGTMGSEFIDYVIGDHWVTPVSHQSDYRECLVQLPHSYQINDRARPIPAVQYSRTELGLPESGTVLCCFNNAWKINQSVFAAWMAILRAVPDSVMWLLGRQSSPQVAANLRAQAHAAGVSPERLVFAKSRPLSAYLALYHHADLFLDTWPYNAHTTASDALWMGCPVLTLTGDTFAARVGASLLAATDLKTLIHENVSDFVGAGIELASDHQRLQVLREHLVTGRKQFSLFNTQETTVAIERAYEEMMTLKAHGFRRPFAVRSEE